jgi:hypothetical protein
VIAAAPSAKAQEQAITLATIRGRISFFGGLPMTAPCTFVNSNLIHYGELSISGAYGSMPRLRYSRNCSAAFSPASAIMPGTEIVPNRAGGSGEGS